jgi:hypothetical protein
MPPDGGSRRWWLVLTFPWRKLAYTPLRYNFETFAACLPG